ncbi:MAG: SDR family oxidoreductase [Gordonibacter sp.]|uniref:SDR family NAD(P)-dependent oxidoreductase n=1 Tax=Gordonibacter sp. TaxID=1968902 RepID=UPI002FC5EB92
MRLEGKKIIVTGGAGGIGGGTVRCCVKEGAQVAIVDWADERGLALEAEANGLAQGSGSAKYYHCDISRGSEVFPAFEEIINDMGGLDVLAHLAARDDLHKQPEDWTEEEMNGYWAVNLNGTILTNQAAFKQFKKMRKGVIINYASDTGLCGSPVQGVYSASKGGVLAWTRSIANSPWAREYNIRSNSVCPQIMTPLYQCYIDSLEGEAKEKFIASRKISYPIDGWPGDADRDAGPVMVFLASEDSRYINGQIISINGGSQITR